jgi:hypothetical protein
MLLMGCDMCSLERNLAEGEPRWCDPDTEAAPSLPNAALSTWLTGPRLVASPIFTLS